MREESGREGSGQSVVDGAVKRSMPMWVVRVGSCLFPEKATRDEKKIDVNAGLSGWLREGEGWIGYLPTLRRYG